jgi:hypothetical protein
MKNKNNRNYSIFYKILRSVARIFLRFGISYREYCELSKTAFIAVAAEDYGVHGRPTNASRISAMTGLTRKEVGRIRKKIERGEELLADRSSPINEVLDAWHTVDDFRNGKGEPKPLPVSGERGSFEALIRQFAGDIPEGAMRKELQRINAIETTGDRIQLHPEWRANVEVDWRLAAESLDKIREQLESAARSVSR